MYNTYEFDFGIPDKPYVILLPSMGQSYHHLLIYLNMYALPFLLAEGTIHSTRSPLKKVLHSPILFVHVGKWGWGERGWCWDKL